MVNWKGREGSQNVKDARNRLPLSECYKKAEKDAKRAEKKAGRRRDIPDDAVKKAGNTAYEESLRQCLVGEAKPAEAIEEPQAPPPSRTKPQDRTRSNKR